MCVRSWPGYIHVVQSIHVRMRHMMDHVHDPKIILALRARGMDMLGRENCLGNASLLFLLFLSMSCLAIAVEKR